MSGKSDGGGKSIYNIALCVATVSGGISGRICETVAADEPVGIMDNWHDCNYRYHYLCDGLYQLSQVKMCPLPLGGSGYF